MKYRQTFVVHGGGQFPFDMLRYDMCFPKFEAEVHMLAADYGAGVRKVTIMRFVDGKTDLPTVDRWRSFGWTVEQETIKTEKRI